MQYKSLIAWRTGLEQLNFISWSEQSYVGVDLGRTEGIWHFSYCQGLLIDFELDRLIIYQNGQDLIFLDSSSAGYWSGSVD